MLIGRFSVSATTRTMALAAGMLLLPGLLAACVTGARARPDYQATGGPGGTYVVPAGIHKIKHVIVVMQENRSFDSYFGTFPGARGIPMRHGAPTVCVPDGSGKCVKPFHETADVNGGGPHSVRSAIADVNHGRMDGFIRQRNAARSTCHLIYDPACLRSATPDVMGYHTAAEIPNYWAYARHFVLNDHMFEAVKSWSLPDHLYMVSGWSAKCAGHSPMSCHNDIGGPYTVRQFGLALRSELATGKTSIDLAWTDITWLLSARHVSWGYYVQPGTAPDCANNGDETCAVVAQNAWTPGIWNPLPLFGDVRQDHQLGNVKALGAYFRAAKAGTLPAVSWLVPSGPDSEHPPASVHRGQAYVTAVINAAMKSPDWKSTAIFVSWDDWGGFYDGVVPPAVDKNGYGLRVPGLVISPYAKRGLVDHQTLSSDAYLKFIEDDFLGGARLNPSTDGRPDRRPGVRENAARLGNLVRDFNFSQPPRAPFLLPTNPPTDSPSVPSYFRGRPACRGCLKLPRGGNSPNHGISPYSSPSPSPSKQPRKKKRHPSAASCQPARCRPGAAAARQLDGASLTARRLAGGMLRAQQGMRARAFEEPPWKSSWCAITLRIRPGLSPRHSRRVAPISRRISSPLAGRYRASRAPIMSSCWALSSRSTTRASTGPGSSRSWPGSGRRTRQGFRCSASASALRPSAWRWAARSLRRIARK